MYMNYGFNKLKLDPMTKGDIKECLLFQYLLVLLYFIVSYNIQTLFQKSNFNDASLQGLLNYRIM